MCPHNRKLIFVYFRKLHFGCILRGCFVRDSFISFDECFSEGYVGDSIQHGKGDKPRSEDLNELFLRAERISYAENAQHDGAYRQGNREYPRAVTADGNIKGIDKIHYTAHQQECAENEHDNGYDLFVGEAHDNTDHRGGYTKHKGEL